MPTDKMTLGEAFPLEQQRCRELVQEYLGIGPAGTFGAAAISAVLAKAEQAAASGDLVAIVAAYQAMKGCE